MKYVWPEKERIRTAENIPDMRKIPVGPGLGDNRLVDIPDVRTHIVRRERAQAFKVPIPADAFEYLLENDTDPAVSLPVKYISVVINFDHLCVRYLDATDKCDL